MKSIYKIIILVVIVGVGGIFTYLSWKNITSGLDEPVQEEEGSGLSDAVVPFVSEEVGKEDVEDDTAKVSLIKMSQEQVFDFWISEDKGEVYYMTSVGRVFAAKNGSDEVVSGQEVKKLISTKVSPKTQRILASFGDPVDPSWGVFDIIDNVWRPLPSGIKAAAWGGSLSQVLAQLNTEDGVSLVEFDLGKSFSSYEVVWKDLRLKDIDFVFKAPRSITITEKPSVFYAGGVWQMDLEKLSLNLVVAPKRGLSTRWSEDGKVIFQFYPPENFFVLDEDFDILAPVPFVTFPEKCTAFNKKVYCFVPKNLPNSAQLPDDYLQRSFYSEDELFVVGTDDLGLRKIGSEEIKNYSTIDAVNPKYNLGDLYFINRRDGYLYKISNF